MANDAFVALLGTKGGPAIRPGSTMPTSSLVSLEGERIVLDCGLGVTRGLVDQGFQLKDLELIIISHLHSDHYLELGPLIHTAWTAGLKTKVNVWGPGGLGQYWEAFLASMDADISLREVDEGRPPLKELVNIHTIDEGVFLDHKGINISALLNIHPPIEETYSISFQSADHHVVFSCDTAYHAGLIPFSKNADLLVHEAMLEAALGPLLARIGNSDDRLMKHWMRSHTLAHDCGKLAALANVKALALHHLIPSDDPGFNDSHWQEAVSPHYDGTLYIGKDGMRIEL